MPDTDDNLPPVPLTLQERTYLTACMAVVEAAFKSQHVSNAQLAFAGAACASIAGKILSEDPDLPMRVHMKIDKGIGALSDKW